MNHLHATCQGLIEVKGPPAMLEKLAHYPGATFHYRPDFTGLTLPFERTAILVAEAVGTADVTDEYRRLRSLALRPSKANLRAVEERFQVTGGTEVPSLLLHQWEYLAHHWTNLSSFNASEQGLGKTRMALALIRIWGCNRILVFLPKGLAQQWKEELPAIWPDLLHRPVFNDLTNGRLDWRADRI